MDPSLKDIDINTYMEIRSSDKASIFSQYYRRLKGVPLRYMNKNNPFAWRHFILPVMDDNHPDKVIKKPRQVGFSEAALNECLWFLCTHSHVNSMYTFPRDKQLKRFSQTRVDIAIEESSYLLSMSPSKVRSVYNKRFGTSFMYLTSAWESALGEGQPLDILFLDEYDRMPDNIETAFTESLSSSIFKWRRRFSTPTIPTRGVSKLFDMSDQMGYFFTCEHCNEKQILTIEKNILQIKKDGVKQHLRHVEEGTFIIVCHKCHKELNRMQKGEWVPAYTNRSIRGYKISQLDAAWIPADDIMRRRLEIESEQLFRNYILGEEWSDSGSLITDSDFEKCVDNSLHRSRARGDYTQISVGIDWGKTNWVVVLGMNPAGRIVLLDLFWYDDTDRPLEAVKMIASKIQLYEPDVIIGDFGYGKDRNALMLELFPGRSYACQYDDSGYLARWNQNSYQIKTNRTISIKQLMTNFKRQGTIIIPKKDDDINLLKEHLCNLTVLMEEDEDTGEIIETIEKLGPDHLAHAFNYSFIGIERDRFMIREQGGSEYTFVDFNSGSIDQLTPPNGTISNIDEFEEFWRGKIDIL